MWHGHERDTSQRSESLVQLVLVIACTRRPPNVSHVAARRVSSDLRPGPSQTIAVVAAAAPRFLLPLLRHPLQSWLQWAPRTAAPVRVIGACLMMSGVSGPFLASASHQQCPGARQLEVLFRSNGRARPA
jgi:hypothetical protein